MRIETVGHQDRYSVEQAVSLFFTPDAELYLTSEYQENEKKIKTSVCLGEKSGEAYFEADVADKFAFKNAVRKSAFLALRNICNAETPWGVLTGIRPTKFLRGLLKGRSEDEAKSILASEYWVSENKIELLFETTKKSDFMLKKMDKKDIGFYVGIPFCPTRCSYCSFVTEAHGIYKKHIPEYSAALEKEVSAMADVVREAGYKVGSVYIGGGTPPVLGRELLASLIDKIKNTLLLDDETEFTVEAGRPDVIDDGLLAMLSARNITRLCINPQTMNDATLKAIGRRHSASDVIRAFELARKYGFDNINSDIIAGLPGENEEMFLYTLDEIGRLSPEEVTVHAMYLKRASELSKGGVWSKSDSAFRMVEAAHGFLKQNGYAPYYLYKQRNSVGNLENTGYSKPGFESCYNTCIMEEENTVIACGAGASSKIAGDGLKRIYNTKDVLLYIKNIDDMIKNKTNEITKYAI